MSTCQVHEVLLCYYVIVGQENFNDTKLYLEYFWLNLRPIGQEAVVKSHTITWFLILARHTIYLTWQSKLVKPT